MRARRRRGAARAAEAEAPWPPRPAVPAGAPREAAKLPGGGDHAGAAHDRRRPPRRAAAPRAADGERNRDVGAAQPLRRRLGRQVAADRDRGVAAQAGRLEVGREARLEGALVRPRRLFPPLLHAARGADDQGRRRAARRERVGGGPRRGGLWDHRAARGRCAGDVASPLASPRARVSLPPSPLNLHPPPLCTPACEQAAP